MNLQETIKSQITPNNFDETHKLNIDLSERQDGINYCDFEDVTIMLKGFKWESYISFDIENVFEVSSGGDGVNDESWSDYEMDTTEITNLQITVDGLELSEANNTFFDEIKSQILETITVTVA